MNNQVFIIKNKKSFEKPILMAYKDLPMANKALENIRNENQEYAEQYVVEPVFVQDFNPNGSVLYMICNRLEKDKTKGVQMYSDPFQAGNVVQTIRKGIRNPSLHKKVYVSRVAVK